jgi:hypothetical protein
METLTFKYRGYRWDYTTEDGVTIAKQRNGLATVHASDEADAKKQIDELAKAGGLNKTAVKKVKVWKPKLDFDKIRDFLIATNAVDAVETVLHYDWQKDGSAIISYVVAWGEREYKPGVKTKVPLITRQTVIHGANAIKTCKMDFSNEKVDKQTEAA